MKEFEFGQGLTRLRFCIQDGRIMYRLSDGMAAKSQDYQATKVLCEVDIVGRATNRPVHMSWKHTQHSEYDKWQYVEHKVTEEPDGKLLAVTQRSDIAKLVTYYMSYTGADAIRTWSVITNISKEPFTIEYISSFVSHMDMPVDCGYDGIRLYVPTNGSYAECQWSSATLKEWGVFCGHNHASTKKLVFNNTGAWSTKTYLPMGIMEDCHGAMTMWQIEANGSWSYELTDHAGNVNLSMAGPSYTENNWKQTLLSGESFETVKAAVIKGGSLNEVMKNVTDYRRRIVHKSRDSVTLPVIFNEYMYASWNTPSDATAKALAPAAKEAGADVYVIDCGWHDEEKDPFYCVGRWEESRNRYPDGLKNTLDYVRGLGLGVGLWMEPEVVGADGDAINMYSDDCYFARSGKVLNVSHRRQLDFRNAKVTDGLNKILYRVMELYEIDYLKIDYNIEPGVGTEYNSESAGNGLLGHNRAYIKWLKGVRKRYPNLILENCASGGNRMDYLSMSISDMQSTSDQVKYHIYPYIAANMMSALLPEQAAVWSYPAAHIEEGLVDNELVALNMINGLGGRMHLASKINLLSERHKKLIKEGVDYYKSIVEFKKQAHPVFPAGFCKMDNDWAVYGLKHGNKAIYFVYCLKGSSTVSFDVGGMVKTAAIVYPLYAGSDEVSYSGNTVTLKFPRTRAARVVEVTLKD